MFGKELTGAARWLVPLALFAGVFVVGLVVRHVLFRVLRKWAAKTATLADDAVVSATRGASYLWFLILAVIAAAHFVDLPGEDTARTVRRILLALLVLSITMAASRLLAELVSLQKDQHAHGFAMASTGLLRSMVRFVVIAIGLLIVLGTLGIKIGPVLGALGIGGLAAGLALQPTLSNLFAGFQISVAKQVGIGHRVRLSTGEEGYVTDISWRTTTLRTPANHLIIIPNSRFADAIVTNYNLPGPRSNLVIQVGVAYQSDPRRVEAVLRDEVQKLIAERAELVNEFEPIVRLQAFGDSALTFNIVVQLHDFDAQFAVWNEIHTRIFERLRREGIEIPFPSRQIYVEERAPARG